MLSEYTFEDQSWKIILNQSYEVIPGVYCESYTIVGDLDKDIAIVYMLPNSKTPLQLVRSGEKTVEVFMCGDGKLVVENNSGTVFEYFFDNNECGKYVIIKIGEKMQWIAGEIGLQFAEICEPPYKDDRFETVCVIGE